MIGGISLTPSQGAQPKPDNKTNETDGTDTTSGGTGTEQTETTTGSQTEPTEGAGTTTGTEPVEASAGTQSAAETYGYPASQDGAASAGTDSTGFAESLAPALDSSPRAAARQMRMETEAMLQVQSLADPVFGPPAPGAPILNAVYNEGVEAATPPESQNVLDIIG